MDSNKTIDAGTSEQSLRQQISSVDLDNLRAESLASIDRLAADFNKNLQNDIREIQERVNKSFRQFLLDREQERMPFLQRVMTSHIENMEDERGFPPRHPVHWFKSKLEFSSTGILEFDFKKDAEVFIESSLAHIETEIKEQLITKQKATLDTVDRSIVALQQDISDRIQPLAKSRKIISTEYVNSFIQTQGLSLKAVDRFYFVSMGARFNSKQELLYSEVCVRPTGLFDRSKDSDKPTQLKYAISCDRLLDIVNESIARSLDQIQQQTQTYLTGELVPQVERLFADIGA
ncbi:hypothetical protein [Chamaesiphon polymorphus]|uniref:Uncharacterized protein n=1 Tax=Chamaesiphon polymorphus CCALA 037 TaxID=2107692 RepID=A0A2T1GL18_9CYAN|nr:hypothetical protein [Chamaesiphon polymorphus]PSB58550.1 hypothetical protein C7B77_04305 [Chamaesiphon polymorphus CCALA 037]